MLRAEFAGDAGTATVSVDVIVRELSCHNTR